MTAAHIRSLLLLTKYGYTCSAHHGIVCSEKTCAIHAYKWIPRKVHLFCTNDDDCRQMVRELLTTVSEEELMEHLLCLHKNTLTSMQNKY